jgi:hypothetical protein
MWRNPVNGQKSAAGIRDAQLLPYLAYRGVQGRFVGFGHAAGQVPVGLVVRVNEQNPALLIAEDDVGTDPLARLSAVTLGKLSPPGIGIALVERYVGHTVSGGG